MKKVRCIVIYTIKDDKYIINKIVSKYNECNNTLYSSDNDELSHKKYNSFIELYDVVLNVLKNCNMYVRSWKEFNSILYDIDYIKTNDFSINRYYYNK